MKCNEEGRSTCGGDGALPDSACGRPEAGQCRKHSSAFWFTVLSGLFLLVTVAGLYLYYAYFFPPIRYFAMGLGVDLPLPARQGYLIGDPFAHVGVLVFLALLLITLAVLVRMHKLPLARAGKGIAVVTLLLLVALLWGVGGGDLFMSYRAQQIYSAARLFRSEVNALDMLDAMNAVQHELATADPASGYACSVSDLSARANKMKPRSDAVETYFRDMDLVPFITGYTFDITGCTGPKSSAYRILARPTRVDPETGTGEDAYCSDPSGVVKKVPLWNKKPTEIEEFVRACK